MVRQNTSVPQLAARPPPRPARDAGRSPNPFAFIVGCPRSGTTLLRRMIDAHSLVAITPETHWVARWFQQRIGLTPEGSVGAELIPRLLAFPQFSRFGIDRAVLEGFLEPGRPTSYARFMSAIYDFYGTKNGKPLVGDKTPGYALELATLHKLFPSAKFVHLIRDGRDVCASFMDWEKRERIGSRFITWPEDRIATAAFWWEWHVRLAREAGHALGQDLYFEIRYEALVNDPASACAALCTFLGLPYEAGMLSFHAGRTRREPGLTSKERWLPPTVGLRDWRLEMSASDVEHFEAIAGDLLEELGYPRAVPRPSAVARERAKTMRSTLTEDVRARGKRLPQGWAM